MAHRKSCPGLLPQATARSGLFRLLPPFRLQPVPFWVLNVSSSNREGETAVKEISQTPKRSHGSESVPVWTGRVIGGKRERETQGGRFGSVGQFPNSSSSFRWELFFSKKELLFLKRGCFIYWVLHNSKNSNKSIFFKATLCGLWKRIGGKKKGRQVRLGGSVGASSRAPKGLQIRFPVRAHT